MSNRPEHFQEGPETPKRREHVIVSPSTQRVLDRQQKRSVEYHRMVTELMQQKSAD